MKKTGSFGALIHAPAHLELSAPWKIAVRLGVLLAILLASTAQARQDADPDTQRQAAILLDRTTGTSPTARAEAARRLVQKRTPAARQVLAGALQERGNPPAQLAAAVALAEDDRPDPSLIDPLFVLTKPDVPLALARPAARALSRYSGNLAVLARLIDRIEDRRGDSRRAAVEALGYFSEKRAAERLIALLNSEDESRAIRDSAVAALTYMTGAPNGNDVGRWNAWWRQAGAMSESDFRLSLITSKAERFDAAKLSNEQLVSAIREQFGAMYRALPPERRTSALLGLLGDGAPAVRAVGAMIVREDKDFAAVIPDEVRDRLVQMVGDSDATVRVQVARALGALNYAGALPALLEQLSVESNSDVKAAIAAAVAPIQELAAVEPLVGLLGDPDATVARSASLALRDLGEKLRRDGDAALVGRVAVALRGLLERSRAPGMEEVRESAVDAMAPLRRQDLIADLQRLLSPRESPRVRRNAIRALAQMGVPELADPIVTALNDPDASVRQEAAIALARIGRKEHIPVLLPRLDERVEPDPSVRDAVWNAIAVRLPDDETDLNTLWRIRDNFPAATQRDRRLIILKAIRDKAIAARSAEQVAQAQEDLGDTYVEANPAQPADAIDEYKSALTYYRARKSAQGVARLTPKVIRAYLSAGKYAEACAFGSDVLKNEPENTQEIGRELKNAAEKLSQSGQASAAQVLIAETAKMDPPLPQSYRSSLEAIAREIEKKLQDGIQDNAQPPRGTRSGTAARPLPFVHPGRLTL